MMMTSGEPASPVEWLLEPVERSPMRGLSPSFPQPLSSSLLHAVIVITANKTNSLFNNFMFFILNFYLANILFFLYFNKLNLSDILYSRISAFSFGDNRTELKSSYFRKCFL